MNAKHIFKTLFILLCLISNAYADGFIVIDKPPLSTHPRPEPISHYVFAPLTVKFHHVDVNILGQVAATQIDQVFYNPNRQRLEGTFIFPLPRGAQIDRFSMFIDGKETEAELLDAKKARRIYEDIVRKMRDPALLEYTGSGAFKLRIFPIEPKSEKRMKLVYTQVLTKDSDLVEYVYPLNTEKFSASPIESVRIKVNLIMKSPVKTVYSPSHDIEIVRNGATRAVVAFEESDTKPDRDFKLYYSTGAPEKSAIDLSLLTYNEDDGQDGYFLLIATPGALTDSSETVRKDTIFVMDTSGSMQGEKLVQAKRAIRYCIDNLNPSDRFDVVRFSTEAESLFGRLEEFTPKMRSKAMDWIDGFKARGGTAIEEALLTAAKPAQTATEHGRPYYVIFLTDGRPTIGNIKEKDILKAVMNAVGDRTVRIFVFGIGTDINTHLLDHLAEKTKAASRYVLPEEDIEVKVSSFFEKIANPALTDVKLDFEGHVRVSKIHPRALPDLFRGDQLILLGRYEGHGDAAVILNGKFNNTPRKIVEEIRFSKPEKAEKNDFIPRLWATRRVGFLLDEIRLNGEHTETVDEVIRLAKRYGIVTPYTSYLILEDEARFAPNMPHRKFTTVAPDQVDTVKRDLGETYSKFKSAKSGKEGVGSSMSTDALKGATAAQSAMERSHRAAEMGKDSFRKKHTYQTTRFIRGRTFFWNTREWVDASAADVPENKVIHIDFGSEAYFKLLARHPDVGAWLSVGNRVRVKIEDKVYVIR